MRLYTVLNKIATILSSHTTSIASLNSNTFALTKNKMISISVGDDLNSYTTAGNYYSENATTSSSLSHTPYTTGLFRLIVSEITSTSRIQIIFTANSSEKIMYYRSSTNSGSTWTGWRLISSSAV